MATNYTGNIIESLSNQSVSLMTLNVQVFHIKTISTIMPVFFLLYFLEIARRQKCSHVLSLMNIIQI